MHFIHPNTKHVIICSERSSLIAEVDHSVADDYAVAMIGYIGGVNSSLGIYKDDWPGFLDIVMQIDAIWKADSNLVGLHQIKNEGAPE